jgi:hypothetical protein
MRDHSTDYERRGDAEWLDSGKVCARPESRDPHASGGASRSALEAAIGRAFHMRVLEEIAQLSQIYPALPLILTENRISIPSAVPDGFPMTIQTERGRYVVRLGKWRDELVLAGEAVELIEASLRGEIRLRIDVDACGQHYTAERRLPTGEWISLPRHEDAIAEAAKGTPLRTLYLRNGPAPR